MQSVDDHEVKEVIVDLGSTYALIDWEFAKKSNAKIYIDAGCRIELANGVVVKSKRITVVLNIVMAWCTVNMKFCVVDARVAYGITLGPNWLKAVDAHGKFGQGVYQIGRDRSVIVG